MCFLRLSPGPHVPWPRGLSPGAWGASWRPGPGIPLQEVRQEGGGPGHHEGDEWTAVGEDWYWLDGPEDKTNTVII